FVAELVGEHLDAGDRLGRGHRHLDGGNSTGDQRVGDVEQNFLRRRADHRDDAGVGDSRERLFFCEWHEKDLSCTRKKEIEPRRCEVAKGTAESPRITRICTNGITALYSRSFVRLVENSLCLSSRLRV